MIEGAGVAVDASISSSTILQSSPHSAFTTTASAFIWSFASTSSSAFEQLHLSTTTVTTITARSVGVSEGLRADGGAGSAFGDPEEYERTLDWISIGVVAIPGILLNLLIIVLRANVKTTGARIAVHLAVANLLGGIMMILRASWARELATDVHKCNISGALTYAFSATSDLMLMLTSWERYQTIVGGSFLFGGVLPYGNNKSGGRGGRNDKSCWGEIGSVTKERRARWKGLRRIKDWARECDVGKWVMPFMIWGVGWAAPLAMYLLDMFWGHPYVPQSSRLFCTMDFTSNFMYDRLVVLATVL
ncbi:hypothetical protein HK102_011910, partial [Quaeritorhiza haematococci]